MRFDSVYFTWYGHWASCLTDMRLHIYHTDEVCLCILYLIWSLRLLFDWYEVPHISHWWGLHVYTQFCRVLLASMYHIPNFWPASVAQLDASSDWRPGGRGFNPRRGRQHSFVEIDHEIFSTVILSLPLIQEGQLSVSGERMCTILVNRLED